MRSQLYRNQRIITTLHDLFFKDDDNSFVRKYGDRFPVSHDDNGVVAREVLVPMLALVATAVSHIGYLM